MRAFSDVHAFNVHAFNALAGGCIGCGGTGNNFEAGSQAFPYTFGLLLNPSGVQTTDKVQTPPPPRSRE